ncbi:uncharacterized protein ACLA_048730 [Aspergillus clavatus NRRL 1]|uniref:SH3 domain protein n=1 Tax=Aspergillus clavatus (strain ATCC 1007 / CBS 513.65 / DSM 816 / NCTC 3887 / NRRL 1 / QM 1276 / 107) TaxID=344612 RepID=A1CHP6_ASPCL|nr:SH3 domain protein [Aspergillus clavatus NRRL 1]EAW10401.1 SH3 domain protein [Aspergillus clavatus NRRL 1]
MSPGAQAGIVVGVLGIAAIMLGLVFFWLHRKKRALQRALRPEKYLPPDDKCNPVSKFASGLYTSSTSTILTVAEMFKHPSKERATSITDAGSSIYSTNQTHGGYRTSNTVWLWKHRVATFADRTYSATSTALHTIAEKLHAVPKTEEPCSDTSSRHSHGYIFAQEFRHLPPPPPPKPARVQKIVSRLYHSHGSIAKPAAGKLRSLEMNNAASPWSSMSGRNRYQVEYDQHQFPPPCETPDALDLVKVRSVSSGTVALSDPAAISVDALAGRISGENLPPQQMRSAKSASPAPSHRSPTQMEVPSVKLWTTQIFRVEMDFAPRHDGHLAVREGQVVRLEQIFDNGWALCVLLETDTQGLLPRACLSTWPIKERRHYAPSSTYSERAGVSPTDSQSIRFYRQHSRPSTPKPSSVKKQAISASLSTVFCV